MWVQWKWVPHPRHLLILPIQSVHGRLSSGQACGTGETGSRYSVETRAWKQRHRPPGPGGSVGESASREGPPLFSRVPPCALPCPYQRRVLSALSRAHRQEHWDQDPQLGGRRQESNTLLIWRWEERGRFAWRSCAWYGGETDLVLQSPRAERKSQHAEMVAGQRADDGRGMGKLAAEEYLNGTSLLHVHFFVERLRSEESRLIVLPVMDLHRFTSPLWSNPHDTRCTFRGESGQRGREDCMAYLAALIVSIMISKLP